MRHNGIRLPLTAIAAGFVLAAPAMAQTSMPGTGLAVPIIVTMVVTGLALGTLFVLLSNKHAQDQANDLARLRDDLYPEAPDGESRSLEDCMARVQRDQASLLAAANALRKDAAEAERLRKEAEDALQKERQKSAGLAANVAALDASLTKEQEAHGITRRDLQRDIDGLKRDLAKVVGEHFATDEVVRTIKEKRPEIDGEPAHVH